MTACMERTTEEKMRLGQRNIKGATKDCFLFESCFYSKRLDKSEMHLGTDMIIMVKTNRKLLCKDTIDNTTKDWPGGSYLILKRKYTVTRDINLIAIGYKYNYRKVPNYIYTEGTWTKKDGIPYYLSNLTSLIMLTFALLLVPFSCLSSLDLLMRLNPTKIQTV